MFKQTIYLLGWLEWYYRYGIKKESFRSFLYRGRVLLSMTLNPETITKVGYSLWSYLIGLDFIE